MGGSLKNSMQSQCAACRHILSVRNPPTGGGGLWGGSLVLIPDSLGFFHRIHRIPSMATIPCPRPRSCKERCGDATTQGQIHGGQIA